MNLEQSLTNYGLTSRQSKVYLACLQLKSAPVQKISQLAGLPRTTCYQVLESLRPLGLVSSFQKKKVRYFSAEDPHTVIKMAQEKSEQLSRALPELVALFGQSNIQPTVRFYQGRQPTMSVMQECLDEAKQLLSFSSLDSVILLDKDFEKFIQERTRRKIKARIIMRDTPLAREMQRNDVQYLREIRFMPESYEHYNLIWIWNNKVGMFSLREDFSVFVIESEALAKFHKTLFEYVWRSLPASTKF